VIHYFQLILYLSCFKYASRAHKYEAWRVRRRGYFYDFIIYGEVASILRVSARLQLRRERETRNSIKRTARSDGRGEEEYVAPERGEVAVEVTGGDGEDSGGFRSVHVDHRIDMARTFFVALARLMGQDISPTAAPPSGDYLVT
jgi:hypothetical protein